MDLIRGYMNILIRVQTRQAQAQLRAMRGGLKQLQGAQVAGASGAATHEGALRRWLNTGTKFGNQLQWTGRQLQYNWTLPLAAAAVATTKWQIANEKALTRIKKVYGDFDLQKALGAEGIAREIEALRKSFVALSNHYGEHQDAVTQIAADWAAAGASGLALAKSTELTLKAMVLGEMEAGDATKALISIQSQYHLSTAGLNRVLAELNVIENQTAVSMGDLIEAFTRTAGVARNAGITTRELGAMVAALVPAAGSAANAGNALKTIISRLLAPTNEAREVLGMMGINLKDTAWQSATATKRLEILAEAFVKLNSGQKAAVSSAVASRWQLNRFDILMEALANNHSYYQKALDATADKAQYMAQAQRELNAVLESNPQKLQQIWVILQNAGAQVIQPLIPAIIMLGQQVAVLAQKFAALDPQVQKTIAVLALLLALIGPLVKYIGSFITLIHVLASGLSIILKPLALFVGMWATLGRHAVGAKATAGAVGQLATAGSKFSLAGKFTAAGVALVAFFKKFDILNQIRGRLGALIQMASGLGGLILVAGSRLARGGGPIKTLGKTNRVDVTGSKRQAQQQTLTYTTALQAGLFAAFNGIGSALVGFFRNIGRNFVSIMGASLRALPVILARFILGPIGLALSAAIGLIIVFKDQIGQIFANIGDVLSGPWNAALERLGGSATYIQKFIEFVKQAFWSLPVEVQNAMIAVATVVRNAAMQIYEWFQYINPFARHSPSLVDNVTKGMDAVSAGFSTLNGAAAPIDDVVREINKLKESTGSLTQGGLGGSVAGLGGDLKSLEGSVKKQEAAVVKWKDATDLINMELDRQQDLLEGLRDLADTYSKKIGDAQERLAYFASAPLKGMRAMEDQIFANQQAQNRLRLEMLKMEDAAGGIQNLSDKISKLNGDIESMRATQTDLRQGGAGSEILGFYDQEIKKIETQKNAIEDQAKPYNDLAKALEDLQRKGEILELEKALQFDGPLREIELLANAQKELGFDEIVKGIRDAKSEIDAYTPALDEVNKAIEQQESKVKSLEKSRDASQRSMDAEEQKLGKVKTAYDKMSDSINKSKTALDNLDKARKLKKLKAKELTPAGQAFKDASGADFPIQGKPGTQIGREGGLGDQTDLIDQYTKDLADQTAKILGSVDIFKPIKDKWKQLKGWFNKNIKPAFGPIADGIKNIFAGIDWGAPFKKGEPLRKFFDSVVTKADKAWTILKKFGGFLKRLFAPDVIALVDDLKDSMGPIWQDLKDAFAAIDWKSVGIILKQFILEPLLLIAKFGIVALVLAVKVLTSILSRTLGPVLRMVASLFKGIMRIVGGVIDVIAGIVEGDFSRVLQGFKKIGQGAVDILASGIENGFRLLGGILEGALDIVPTLINAAFDIDLPTVRELIDSIGDIFSDLKDSLPRHVQDAIDLVVEKFVWLWDKLTGHSIVPDMIDDIIDEFKRLALDIDLPLRDTIELVIEKFKWLWDKLTGKSIVPDMIDDIINCFKDLVKRLPSPLKEAYDLVVGKFNDLYAWFRDTWIGKRWSTVAEKIRKEVAKAGPAIDKEMPGIQKVFNDLYAWFRDTWIGKRWSTVKDRMLAPLIAAKTAISDILTGKRSIRQVFADAVVSIGKAWDGLKEKTKAPIRFMVNTVLNSGLIAAFNFIARKVGAKELGNAPLPRGFDSGGNTGPGPKMKPAGIVHADEHVWTKAEMAKFPGGHRAMEQMRKDVLHGDIKSPNMLGYATGGAVAPTTTTGTKTVGNYLVTTITKLVSMGATLKADLDKALGSITGIGTTPWAELPKAAARVTRDNMYNFGKNWVQKIVTQTKEKIASVGGSLTGGGNTPVSGGGRAGARAAALRLGAKPVFYHSETESGRPAFDAMVRNDSIGNAVARHLVGNRGRYGTYDVIWNRGIWSARGGWRRRPYRPIRDTGDYWHDYHVHAAFRNGTLGASRRGLALVGERGPELRDMRPGTKILNSSASSSLVGSEFSVAVSRAFARAMSASTPSLEQSLVASVASATRRANRRIEARTAGEPMSASVTPNTTRTVVIQEAVFPNVRTGSDAKAFLDNLATVTSP